MTGLINFCMLHQLFCSFFTSSQHIPVYFDADNNSCGDSWGSTFEYMLSTSIEVKTQNFSLEPVVRCGRSEKFCF